MIFGTLLTSDYFMRLMDFFKGTKKYELCKNLLASFGKVNDKIHNEKIVGKYYKDPKTGHLRKYVGKNWKNPGGHIITDES